MEREIREVTSWLKLKTLRYWILLKLTSRRLYVLYFRSGLQFYAKVWSFCGGRKAKLAGSVSSEFYVQKAPSIKVVLYWALQCLQVQRMQHAGYGTFCEFVFNGSQASFEFLCRGASTISRTIFTFLHKNEPWTLECSHHQWTVQDVEEVVSCAAIRVHYFCHYSRN